MLPQWLFLSIREGPASLALMKLSKLSALTFIQLMILSHSHGAVGWEWCVLLRSSCIAHQRDQGPSDSESATFFFLAFYTFCCFTLVRTFLHFPPAFEAVLLWEYFWNPSRLTHGECWRAGGRKEEQVLAKIYYKELIWEAAGALACDKQDWMCQRPGQL